MKQKLGIVFYLISMTAASQPNEEIVKYLSKNFPRLSIGYILFFEPELAKYCSDTTNRPEIVKAISREKEWIKEDGNEGAKERKVFLSILYKRIKNISTKTKAENESKNYLLNLLEPFKIDFAVDEKLLESRFNPKNRGLPFGDEECDADFSFYVFFLYDPALYVKVLKNNKVANPLGKMRFPTTCFLEELSHIPLIMKKRIQSELLKIINKYKGPEFDVLRSKIKNADLNAKYN